MIPDYTTPILGVRDWRVSPDGTLYSTTRPVPWCPHEEQSARCDRPIADSSLHSALFGASPPPKLHEHDAPHLGCTCGLYAFYNEDPEPLGTSYVRGVVLAWGKIVLCDYGFKAERMKIAALFSPPGSMDGYGPIFLGGSHRNLAERYGVPLLAPASLETLGLGGIVMEPLSDRPPPLSLQVTYNARRSAHGSLLEIEKLEKKLKAMGDAATKAGDAFKVTVAWITEERGAFRPDASMYSARKRRMNG